MNKYDFRAVLRDTPEMTEDLAEQLFSEGCDDGTPGMFCGVSVIDFHRESESLEKAIRSAIAQVKATGTTVERVEIDAVDLSPIA